jgi:hypothetical protein
MEISRISSLSVRSTIIRKTKINRSVSKAAGGGFLSFGRSKFSPLDVKRVYFGNWLRDYSQAVDTAGLKKTNLQTILNVVMVLGFLGKSILKVRLSARR